MKKFVLLVLLYLAVGGCMSCGGENAGDSDGPGLLSFSDEQADAVKKVEEANDELKRIRILYRENNAKVEELKKALGNKDLDRVKRLADDLQLVINDGYAFAELAIEKLTEAQRLDINSDFKYYLSLKEESLRLQIKAFDFRRASAKLFRDKFGTNDPNAMAEAAKKFTENEANFEKKMAEARKVSEEADKLFKEVNNRE